MYLMADGSGMSSFSNSYLGCMSWCIIIGSYVRQSTRTETREDGRLVRTIEQASGPLREYEPEVSCDQMPNTYRLHRNLVSASSSTGRIARYHTLRR